MRVTPAVLCIVLSILNLEMNQSIFIEIFFGSCGWRYFFQKLQKNSHKFSFNKHIKTYIIQGYKIKLRVNQYRRLLKCIVCCLYVFLVYHNLSGSLISNFFIIVYMVVYFVGFCLILQK
jgi:hypothetical protein